MFRQKDIGVSLDSRECILLTRRKKGEIEEHRFPALAQIQDGEIRAIGQRAYKLVGKSDDIVSVFPGRIEDPYVLAGYLQRIAPKRSALDRQRVWASVPTAASLQLLLNIKSCIAGSLMPRETVLVPDILAAAIGAGVPVLHMEEDSQRGRMIIHVGGSRISAGVFVDGRLSGVVVREGSWDQLIREVQENIQFRLGTSLGFNTFYKVVRSLSRSFFERHRPNGTDGAGPPQVESGTTLELGEPEDAGSELAQESIPPNLRSFSERGLIEYVVEDEAVSRAIDIQLKNLLFGLEKVVFGCFTKLRTTGRGEIASDLFSDRVIICGDVFFDSAALAVYFTKLSRFRFETQNGHPIAKGLRRILSSDDDQKAGYRELSAVIQEQSKTQLSRV